jgi:hypothetical protein
MNRRPLAPLALLAVLLGACETYGSGYYHTGPAWGLHLSLVGSVIAIGDIWACYQVWTGQRSVSSKVLWTVLVWCFPFGGLLLFWMFGDRSAA